MLAYPVFSESPWVHRATAGAQAAHCGPTTLGLPNSTPVLFGSRTPALLLSSGHSAHQTLECLDPDEYAGVARLERNYLDLNLGLADCATVLLAARLRTRRVLTFDERHFRAVQPLQGSTLELLPPQ